MNYPQFCEFYMAFRNGVMDLYSRHRTAKFDRKDVLFRLLEDIKGSWKSYKTRFVHKSDSSGLANELRKMSKRYDVSPVSSDFLP